ncbi:MAG: hypothetical protein GQ538_02090, partial [Xanthomonadales bacterium]|nr:hypothetical protein [Xanthomonadales bacterium]
MNLKSSLLQKIVIAITTVLLVSCEQPVETAPAIIEITIDPATEVNNIADKYYAFTLEHTPEIAYFSGVELPRHDGMENNSLSAKRT